MPIPTHSLDQHWQRVTRNFVLDALLLPVAFKLGASIRFVDLFSEKEMGYLPAILIGSLALPSLLYIFGFYASGHLRRDWRKDFFMLLVVLGLTSVVVMAAGSLVLSARVGRGVLGLGMAITAVAVLARHLAAARGNAAKRTAYVVGSTRDEELAESFARSQPGGDRLTGIFTVPGYKLTGRLQRLGSTKEIESIVDSFGIECVMCDERLIDAPGIGAKLRKLRFQGVTISTLLHAYEERYQVVPLELVTERWLLNASSQPQMIYIRKLKRAFDVAVSSLMLILLAPVCALAALAVALTSKGPIIYRQTRSGKFGRPFQLLKFRSMRVDAEADGKARWWQHYDPRETPIGHYMRKFRIDEIPQLVNILRGEMSFVGPRPERPEFVAQLSKEVPFYHERMMVLPGLTGWAQVNYPYGSSVHDAERKMEFDLYYMKHMSLVLDLFIMLDTLRTVLRGGAIQRETGRQALSGLKPAAVTPSLSMADAA